MAQADPTKRPIISSIDGDLHTIYVSKDEMTPQQQKTILRENLEFLRDHFSEDDDPGSQEIANKIKERLGDDL